MPKKATRRPNPRHAKVTEADRAVVREFADTLEAAAKGKIDYATAAENCAALAGPHNPLRPVQRYESLTRDQWEKIARMFRPASAIVAGLNFVDHRFGAGVIDDGTKCVWTRQKRRIELWYKDGAMGASLSRFEDPECPLRAQQSK